MTPAELQAELAELMALLAEPAWFGFKEAKNNHDFDDLGRYVSALSNEAKLKPRIQKLEGEGRADPGDAPPHLGGSGAGSFANRRTLVGRGILREARG
jgi:hypothetical protein